MATETREDTRLVEGMRTYVKWLLVLLASSPPLILASFYGYVYETGNFHTVVMDEAYRSAQLDEEQLTRYIGSRKIKSIVNLRGPNTGSKWYQDELRVSNLLGVVHHDFGISANHEVSDEDLDAILHLMRQLPKPLLIHCRSGADRTGLIAAIYQYSIGHHKALDASGQLSMMYGHFPYLGNSTIAMDRSYWHYVDTHAMLEVRNLEQDTTSQQKLTTGHARDPESITAETH